LNLAAGQHDRGDERSNQEAACDHPGPPEYKLDDVRSGTPVIGSATLGIVVRKGLDDALTRLQREAARAKESVRAEILYTWTSEAPCRSAPAWWVSSGPEKSE
jgi:hypothetical protein